MSPEILSPTSETIATVADDTLVTPAMALDHVGDAVDYVLGGHPDGTTRASTILSLAAGDSGEGRVLREGDVTASALETAAQLSVS